MNKLLALFLLLNALPGLCQAPTGNPGKWKAGFTFAVDNYLNATDISTGPHTGYTLTPAGPNYTTGLVGFYALKPNLGLGTGLRYSNKDYSGTFYCHTCDFNFIRAPQAQPIKQRYVEVPLVARYYFRDKQVDLYAEAGLAGGFLTREMTTWYEGSPWAGNKFLLTQQTGLGAGLDLGPGLNLSLTASYKVSRTDLREETDFKLKAWGLIAGLSYRFKKRNSAG